MVRFGKIGTVVLLALITLAGAVSTADADFTFGEPTNLGPPINSTARDYGANPSADGLSLYFCSDRPGGHGTCDLWVAARPTTSDPWQPPANLGSVVNSSAWDSAPSISADGLSLYFESNRSGVWDIWVATRVAKDADWGSPTNLGPTFNSQTPDLGPCISADGLSLFFDSGRSGGYGMGDMWVATRATIDEPWGQPENLGPPVNTSFFDTNASISADGLALFFASNRSGNVDLWYTLRATISDPWDPPVNMGNTVNSLVFDNYPKISADGRILYFNAEELPGGLGGNDQWQVAIDPIVDFDDDGAVDGVDINIMVDFWGTDEPLCDIGPMPWGDGVVDVQDLIVLVENMVEQFSPVEPQAVNVNEDDDDGQVELEPGQILIVTLESNPTTGYRWEQVKDQESILEQIGEAEFKPSETDDPPPVGAGGWEILRFKAVSAGQMTLELVYHRSWEEDVEPLETFSIQVLVR